MRDQIVVAIPAYGRSFTLASSTETSMGAAITGDGPRGPLLNETGILAYYEVCASKWIISCDILCIFVLSMVLHF